MDIQYTIYVAATLQTLWDTLTSAEALEKNWGKIESRWTAGSPVAEVDGAGKILWRGEVLRSEAPGFLSFTFQVSGSEEPSTTVSYALSHPGTNVAAGFTVVRLSVRQTGFPEGSKLRAGCERAWIEIMSSLKTYVETGKPLGFAWKH